MQLAVLLGAVAPGSAAAKERFFERWPVELQGAVTDAARRFPGTFALYVKDVASGVAYTYNASTPMYLASGVKLPVLVAVYDQLGRGKLRMDDELVYRGKNIRDGAPVFSYFEPGDAVPLSVAVDAMIQHSDNAATDLILQRIGLKAVPKTLKAQGLTGFGPITSLLDVRRLVYARLDKRSSKLRPTDIFQIQLTKPFDARVRALSEAMGYAPDHFSRKQYVRAYWSYYATGYNSASMVAMGNLLEKLARQKLVSRDASQAMLRTMLGTRTGAHRAAAGLPKGTPWAHKTGTQFARTCDFGIFYLGKRRPIVFAISVEGGRRSQAEALIAKLAERASYFLSSPEKRRALDRARAARKAAAEDALPPIDGAL